MDGVGLPVVSVRPRVASGAEHAVVGCCKAKVTTDHLKALQSALRTYCNGAEWCQVFQSCTHTRYLQHWLALDVAVCMPQ